MSSPSTPGGSWARAVVASGGSAPVADAGGRELDARYAEPHRRYHVGAHIAAVLRNSDELAVALWLAEAERAALTLAACAHDVVYDARPGDDERASAEWARAQLTAAGVREPLVHRVAQLVLATLTHEAPDTDLAAAALLDADLAVLAAPRADYDAYVAAVRVEYSWVPEADWRTGRAEVLLSLANRPRIYLTETGGERWEARARHNLARELHALTFSDGAP